MSGSLPHTPLQRWPFSSILTQPLRYLAGICAVFLQMHGLAQAQAGGVELELFGGHDSNPSRAQAGNTLGAENIQGARVTMLRSVLLDERSGMIFQGGGTIQRHSAFSGLNNIALNAGVAYRIQPTVGYAMPWYELSLDLERHLYANSAIRDGASAALDLSIGKHFTDRLYSTTGVGIKRSLADQANLFDLTERKLFVILGYRFSLENTFYVTLSKRRGDQVFGARETFWVGGRVKAKDDDPVFGESYYAYRMDAASTIAEAGVNLPVRGNGALDIRAKRSRTYAYGGPAYEYTLMLISWRYRFF